MANSTKNSPPAPSTPGAASPSNGSSSSSSSSSSSPPSPKSSTSAPPPNDSSGSPPPPAPSQQDSPPSSQTPGNSQPTPPSEGSSSSSQSPPGPSSNQSPSQSSSPPSQGSNDGHNNDKGNNNKGNNDSNNNKDNNDDNKDSSYNNKNKGNNNDNNSRNNDSGNNNDKNIFSPPSSHKDKDSGDGNHSSPRSLGPPKGASKSSGGSDSTDIAKIVGVVAGAGLLLLVLTLLCVCCKRKKKRRSKLDHMQYYNASPFGDGTGGGGYHPQKQYHQNDHAMNLPPPPAGSWGAAPSPQPPVSGGHGSNSNSSHFSGQHGPSPPTHSPMGLGFNQSTFTYDELAMATQGFSESNVLGQGGFGYVYKGVLPNGKEVAVKSLKTGSGQGEREFQAEVDIISRVHHRHLVSLVGYCIAGDQRMLVYEFLPNNTLEFHLHGKGRPVMDWSTRMKIALGSAKGLAYLHEDCQFRIIHRDIKASNILLDFSFEAKVADFGLAKLSQDNYTHVSTRVMGTFGYLAPEYASSGKLTEKSDVFSFGVMLLELITGRPPIDLTGEMEDSLVEWARPLCLKAAQEGDYSELGDPRLEGKYEQHEMARMAASAAAAIRHSARRRPKMSQIVRALEGDVSLDDLNEGVKPGQSTYFGTTPNSGEYNGGTYSADMRRFRQLVMNSQEYESSEYSATSEYGLNNSNPSSGEMHRRKL